MCHIAGHHRQHHPNIHRHSHIHNKCQVGAMAQQALNNAWKHLWHNFWVHEQDWFGVIHIPVLFCIFFAYLCYLRLWWWQTEKIIKTIQLAWKWQLVSVMAIWHHQLKFNWQKCWLNWQTPLLPAAIVCCVQCCNVANFSNAKYIFMYKVCHWCSILFSIRRPIFL